MTKVSPPGTHLPLSCCHRPSPLRLQAAYLEARTCQAESRYLDLLRQLQDTKSLDAPLQEAVEKLVEEALRAELQAAGRPPGTRYWAALAGEAACWLL